MAGGDGVGETSDGQLKGASHLRPCQCAPALTSIHNEPTWQSSQMVYRASAPTQTIEVPKRCLAIHLLGSEWLCEQTDQLSRLAPNETVMEMENKHLIQPADSQVAVWQRGRSTFWRGCVRRLIHSVFAIGCL